MNVNGKILMFSIVVMLATGCAGTSMRGSEAAASPDPVMETQDKNIGRLYELIGGLTARIDELEQGPKSPDPILEEIRNTDIAGMKLRKEQLMLFLDHCRFSKKLLRESRANPGDKQKIEEIWNQHQEQLLNKLDELDQKEDALERKRVQLEMQLIRNSLE